ncbi:hypothetical protein [Asticcacaulis sp. AC402]|uniref:hypothetical protein n=1 Tax=Asticcacaulis sp. AC402 TaxID=1282361 RepID=UPI0003C3AD59|nr:hypothetical protein [Asticcacaulis sp. AC402]ESQ74385.1 hypothetical protein ABAC402_14740 [Asticcacaulis sp. AC402]
MSNEDAIRIVQIYAEGHAEGLSVEEEIRLGNDLFNNLKSIEDIVPMLVSGFETAEWRACYIVSESDEIACHVFPYIIPLIRSKRPSIRNIACECYRWCANSGVHVAEVIKCLEDPERSVRLRAVIALSGIHVQLIQDAIVSLRIEGKVELAHTVEIIVVGDLPFRELNFETVKLESRLKKLCYYVLAVRAGVSDGELIQFVKTLDEPDLLFFHRR